MIQEKIQNTLKIMDNLNHENVEMYAIKAYNKFNYIKSEFEEDFMVFRYVKRLLQKYRLSGELRENLILNHLNLIYNVFGIESGTRLLFFKIDKDDYSTLKTFLLYLNTMPEIVSNINGKDILSSDIPVDMAIANLLRRI